MTLCLQSPVGSQTKSPLATGYAFSLLHEYKNAIDKYESYIKNSPNSSKQYYIAHNNKGNAYYELGDFESAVSAYKAALKTGQISNYEQSVIHYNLANALMDIQQDYSHLKKTEIQFNSNINQANQEPSLKDKQIIEEYKKAIQLNPYLLEAYNNLALVYSYQKDGRVTAIKYLQESLRMSANKSPPEDVRKVATLYFNLGNLMYEPAPQSGQSGESSRIGAINIRSAGGTVHIRLCGNNKECIEKARLSLPAELSQQNSNPAQRQTVSREPEKAPLLSNSEKIPQVSEEISPRNIKQFQDIIQQYKRAIDLDPEFIAAHNNLGVLYLEAGEIEQAIEYFNKVLSLDSQSLFAHLNLGTAFFKSGRIKQGEEQYQIVKRLRKKFIPTKEEQGLENLYFDISVLYDLNIGKTAEAGLGDEQLLSIHSVQGQFQPQGSKYKIPILTLWNSYRVFGSIDIPIESPNQIETLLKYAVLPKEKFQDTTLTSPVVRVLAIFKNEKLTETRTGAGFLVKKDGQRGYILTAYHNLLCNKTSSERKVEQEPDKIIVQFLTPIPEVRQARLAFRGLEDTDVEDLALLQVYDVPSQIPPIALENTLLLKQGEKATIVGHPQSKRWQKSKIEFVRSINNGEKWIFRDIQGAIQPGYSGGPIYSDRTGRVISMVTRKADNNKEISVLSVEPMGKILHKLLSK